MKSHLDPWMLAFVCDHSLVRFSSFMLITFTVFTTSYLMRRRIQRKNNGKLKKILHQKKVDDVNLNILVIMFSSFSHSYFLVSKCK